MGISTRSVSLLARSSAWVGAARYGSGGGIAWKRVLAFGLAAYVWPIADDSAINLDLLLGNGLGHDFMELLLKVLMIAFAYLAIREAAKGTSVNGEKAAALLVLVAFSFILANFDDLAVFVRFINFVREPQFWVAANAATEAASVGFFYLALRRATRS